MSGLALTDPRGGPPGRQGPSPGGTGAGHILRATKDTPNLVGRNRRRGQRRGVERKGLEETEDGSIRCVEEASVIPQPRRVASLRGPVT